MAKCEVCGNDYDKTFQVTQAGRAHLFDCFECAIQALAPVCKHCGCRVIGHGVEAGGKVFCCASCASKEGVRGMKDRVETGLAGVAGSAAGARAALKLPEEPTRKWHTVTEGPVDARDGPRPVQDQARRL